ncbi:MAG: hypothetical protein PVJ84_22630 [Desulfobacteraceae bacterium]|jgi:hypothetical protein
MGARSRWRSHFQENKTLFIILAVGLFLVELEIFAMASMGSGRKSIVQVLDQQSNVIYEVKSAKLNSQEKAEFEKTFGPLSDYHVNVVTQQRPFPFRPWFAAAVGLPIGAVLLFGFFVKAYEALFFKNEGDFTSGGESPSTAFSADRLDRLLHRVGRLNIFAIGGFVLIFALGLWALPHLLSEFGRHGVALVIRYKWVALAIAAVFLAFVAWIVFLRYLLARKAIETQAEVEKYRLQLELMGSHQKPAQLAGTQQTKLALPQKPLAQSAQSDKDHRTPS